MIHNISLCWTSVITYSFPDPDAGLANFCEQKGFIQHAHVMYVEWDLKIAYITKLYMNILTLFFISYGNANISRYSAKSNPYL